MTTIQLNDRTIELTPQPAGTYLQLANNFMPALAAGEPFAKVCAMVLADGLKQNAPTDHPLFQCTLWMLHQVGVRTVKLDLEKQSADFGTPEASSLEGRPYGEHFTPGNVATGRAMVASLMLVTARHVRVNGEEWLVRVQPIQTMQRVNQETLQSRKFGEELHVTAVRRLLSLVLGGKPKDDPEVLAALQVVADLNVRSFRYSEDGRQVAFEAFNEPNALAMAYLHNMDDEQRAKALARVQQLNARCQGAPVPDRGEPPQRRRRS